MLIDTSAWVEYYRPLPTQSQARHRNLLFKDLIDDHLDQDELVYTSPTIVQELLQGTKTDTDWRRILRDIDAMVFLWLNDQMTMAKEAANIYRRCRKEGVTVRKSPDCLIAQVALYYDLPLLHNDRDFNQIANVFPLKVVDLPS